MLFSLLPLVVLLVGLAVTFRAGFQSYSTLDIVAADGDAPALARDVLSPAVLDAALDRKTVFKNMGFFPLRNEPRFAQAKDPRAELRNMITVAVDRESHTVTLSLASRDIMEQTNVLQAIGEASVTQLGLNRARPGTPHFDGMGSMSLFRVIPILAVMSCTFTVCYGILARRRGGASGASKPRLTIAGLMIGMVAVAMGLGFYRWTSPSEPVPNSALGEFHVPYGTRVLKKYDVPLMSSSGKVIKEEIRYNVYQVRKGRGDTLEVELKDNVAGELKFSDVVELDNAISYFTQDLQKDPTSAPAFARRASAEQAQGLNDEALADFNEALRLDPEDISAWKCRARLWFKLHDFDRAINDIGEAIKRNPKDARAHFERSEIWSRRGDAKRRIDDLSQAIKLDPNYKEAYYERALYLMDNGGLDQGMADLDAVIRIDPDSEKGYWFRGTGWAHKGDLDRALADFSQAIRCAPKSSLAYVDRARVYFARKEYDKALEDSNFAVKAFSWYADAYFIRGITRSAQQEYRDAIADFDLAIKYRYRPSLAPVYAQRALAWERSGDFKKAVGDYEKAIGLNANDSWSRNGLAWLRATCPDETARDGRQAVDLATKACELTRWKDGSVVDTLAAAFAEVGDFDKAVEHQVKANALMADPQSRTRGEERLVLYRAKKPYRESAVADRAKPK